MAGIRRCLLRIAPGGTLTAAVAAGTLAAAVAGATVLIPGVAAAQVAAGPVSPNPASGTPELAPSGTTEQIRQLVKCNDVMYAAGTFTKIRKGGTTYRRNNVFSCGATAPYQVT